MYGSWTQSLHPLDKNALLCIVQYHFGALLYASRVCNSMLNTLIALSRCEVVQRKQGLLHVTTCDGVRGSSVDLATRKGLFYFIISFAIAYCLNKQLHFGIGEEMEMEAYFGDSGEFDVSNRFAFTRFRRIIIYFFSQYDIWKVGIIALTWSLQNCWNAPQ
jgi:hypothetical protein